MTNIKNSVPRTKELMPSVPSQAAKIHLHYLYANTSYDTTLIGDDSK